MFGKKVLYRWVNSEAYLEPSRTTSKIELFAKIVNG